MKNNKGVTLTVLVLTIIVLLILAGISISVVFNEEGLLERAEETRFKTLLTFYQTKVDAFTVGRRVLIKNGLEENISSINAGATELTPKMEFKNIIGEDIRKKYKDKVCVEGGEFYYVPLDINDKQVKKEVKWCFEIGIQVKGYSSLEDFEVGSTEVPKGDYILNKGLWLNEPDLTGFSKTHTYYVLYDENGENEKIGEKILKEKPKDWYDYVNKIWANVVTIDNGKMAYWVWIPRYAYKIIYYADSAQTILSPDNAVTSYGEIDVRFLSKNNVWKDFLTENEIAYTEESLEADGYKLPDAFTWDDVNISGYWVSKYEVNPSTFNVAKLTNGNIEITNIDGKNTGTYEYYLDGELITTMQGLYTFENLEFNRNYEITIKTLNSVTGEFDLVGTRIIKTTIYSKDSVPREIPDVTGFKDAIAYYVLYDENGKNETIGDRIIFDSKGNPTNIPDNWYNYSNKIWANIVTSNEELTLEEKYDITLATTKNIAYWVWIPRYEYKVVNTALESDYLNGDTVLNEYVIVHFINKKTTSPTIEDFKIPDAFNWDGKPLAGYWVSKYEVSEGITAE